MSWTPSRHHSNHVFTGVDYLRQQVQKCIRESNLKEQILLSLNKDVSHETEVEGTHKKKKEELNKFFHYTVALYSTNIVVQYSKLYWLLERNSELSVHNKIMIYRQIFKSVWMYGIKLWACTNKSNIAKIQVFHNKVLSGIVNAPWHLRNSVYIVTCISLVTEDIKKKAVKQTCVSEYF